MKEHTVNSTQFNNTQHCSTVQSDSVVRCTKQFGKMPTVTKQYRNFETLYELVTTNPRDTSL